MLTDTYEQSRRRLLEDIRRVQDRHQLELKPLMRELVRLEQMRAPARYVLRDGEAIRIYGIRGGE